MTALPKLKLYPYQLDDVKRVCKEPTRAALIASDTGAGKTLEGVEIMLRTIRKHHVPDEARVLIVGPLNTLDGWRSTLARQTEYRTQLRYITGVAGDNEGWHTRQQFLDGVPGWYFVGWEYLLRLDKEAPTSLYSHPLHGLVLDEVHRGSGRPRHDKSMQIIGGYTSEAIFKLGQLTERSGGWRVKFSATPFGNEPAGAWSVGRAAWPSMTREYGSFWRWATRHLERHAEEYKGQRVEVVGKELAPGSIVAEMPCYIRHDELLPCCKYHPNGMKADLPGRVIHRVGVPLSATQRKLYDQLESDMMAWVEDHEWPIETNGYPMVQALRMHQVCLGAPTTELKYKLKQAFQVSPGGETTETTTEVAYIDVKYPIPTQSMKFDAIEDILKDIPADQRVIIYTHSAGIIPPLVDRLNKKFGDTAAWYGAVPQWERNWIKDAFTRDSGTGSVRIIVAQIDSIANGTDGLQRVCHNEIWLSFSNSMIANKQAVGRLWRDGQEHLINVWYVYAEDTIELDQSFRLDSITTRMSKTLLPSSGRKVRSGRKSKKKVMA